MIYRPWSYLETILVVNSSEQQRAVRMERLRMVSSSVLDDYVVNGNRSVNGMRMIFILFLS